MQAIASKLRKKGHEVYCPFELQIPNAWDMSQEEWTKKVFDADIRALITRSSITRKTKLFLYGN